LLILVHSYSPNRRFHGHALAFMGTP
jgi:hypothetical protein